jgi:acetolactate synthase I/II/III large subunit
MNETATRAATKTQIGAQLLVRNLEAQGVQYIFGIPGAKIDAVFNALIDTNIKMIVCRHEQNAAFIAGGLGRLTGKAGVVLVTSGPGCTNLVTGLTTANTEGDPVVAFGGAVPISERLKHTHQSVDTVSLFRPITKFAAEVDSPAAISEVFANAFRSAESGRPGAAFVSLPQDVMSSPATAEVLAPVHRVCLGAASMEQLDEAARLISEAQNPVILLGLQASQPATAQSIRALLNKTRFAVTCTYQAAGVVPRELLSCFAGRVGFFHNQAADMVLDAADVVVTIGYDPVEYDPRLWNHNRNRTIIHIDSTPVDFDKDYRPTVELIGDIAATLVTLSQRLRAWKDVPSQNLIDEAFQQRELVAQEAMARGGFPIHPLRVVHELQELSNQDVTICCDMGSFHLWMARYLYSFRPRQILISNGQQTLGVGLPWAIAACLARPKDKVISVSGDGGFLFSAMELETAVRLKCNFVHLIWIDGAYDMVRFQQIHKYGRDAAVEFGPVDVVDYAESFGARGFSIRNVEELRPTLKKAMDMSGPVLIGVPVDYSDNHQLMEVLRPNVIV